MKKMFVLLLVMVLGATSMKAQNTGKNPSWAAEFGIGSELELGARAQYGLNQYLSWDVLHLKYAFDYGDVNFHELTLTTGLRGYSPTFGPKLKAFAALDLGYGGITSQYTDWTNCFALDFTIGLYVMKNLYVGYGLGVLANDGSHKDHVLRIGYNF